MAKQRAKRTHKRATHHKAAVGKRHRRKGGFLHKVVPTMWKVVKSIYKPRWDAHQLERAHRRRTIQQ